MVPPRGGLHSISCPLHRFSTLLRTGWPGDSLASGGEVILWEFLDAKEPCHFHLASWDTPGVPSPNPPPCSEKPRHEEEPQWVLLVTQLSR